MNPRYLVLIFALALAALPTAVLAEGGGDDHAESEGGDHAESEDGESSEAAHGDDDPAEAGHGEGGHINWWSWDDPHAPPLGLMFVNFALLLVILYFILRKPIGGGAKERRIKLEKEIGEARELKQAAESALNEAKSKIEALDAEMAKLRQDILDGGKAEAARITSDAEARAERMQADTTALVEQEVARMSRAIREDVVSGIVEKAEAVIREKIRDDDQSRLAREYLQEMSDTASDKPGN